MSQFKKILIPVDNSKHSNFCIDIGLKLASVFGSKLVGNHVYAAKLHDDRFVQMEACLPAQYQEPQELKRQRDIHDSLITQGLQLISESFLDYFSKSCDKAGIPFDRKVMEGKNYYQIVKDINESDYSMVVMGAYGLGALDKTSIGSVTSRVVRRSAVNVLVVRKSDDFKNKIVVCIDGSPKSFAAVRSSATIATVLSEEAGKVFKFKEQEKLHDEIIDKGLEKIYQTHLNTAKKIAEVMGVSMKTTLLAGRAIEKIHEYIEKEEVSLIAVGRTGIHSDNGLDIGSISENMLININCNLLVVTESYVPPSELDCETNTKNIPWSEEAIERVARIPEFVRNMAKKAILDFAISKGYGEVTGDVVNEARKSMGM